MKGGKEGEIRDWGEFGALGPAGETEGRVWRGLGGGSEGRYSQGVGFLGCDRDD